MLFISYTRFSKALPDDAFQQYLEKVPEEIRQKILRFRRWQDAHASLFGKLLLLKAAEKMGVVSFSLSQLKYNSFDRPYSEGAFDFNITHTDGLVACAFSTRTAVGIDVERVRPIDLKEFTNVYTENELQSIRHAADPHDRFFHFWTRKEALIKADGRGMSLNLTDIDTLKNEVTVGEKVYFLHSLELDEVYQVHLATDGAITGLEIREYDF